MRSVCDTGTLFSAEALCGWNSRVTKPPLEMPSYLTFAAMIFMVFDVGGSSQVRIYINGSSPIFITDKKSPSFALGMGIFEYGWTKYLNNTKLLTLVRALGPSYLRIGGTKSDYSFFNSTGNSHRHRGRAASRRCDDGVPDDIEFQKHRAEAYHKEQLFFRRKLHNKLKHMDTHIVYTRAQFDDFMKFVTCAGWNLIFDLNLLDRQGGSWNPANTIQLLNYAKQCRYHVNWELGNEPNSYFHKTGIRLTAQQVAKGFLTLNDILKSDDWWTHFKLVGPDVNSFSKESSHKFLKKFLSIVGKDMNAVTFHQYYIDSRISTADNFTDPAILNELLPQVKAAVRVVKEENLTAPVWLGETSSSYGGGAKGLSNTYIAGFMWLDKLGVCAANGIDVVFRQTLLEGNYAIINDNFDPLPDYWLSVLYKTLVGPRVLQVITSHGFVRGPKPHPGRVRVYAHCTNTDRTSYPLGSVTVYYLNMTPKKKSLTFHPNTAQNLERAMVYQLTSSQAGLNSSDVLLNGRILQMPSVHSLPPLPPRVVHPTAKKGISLPRMSFGFIVLPDIQMRACMEN